MKKIFSFVLVLIMLLSSSFSVHKYYTSITKIEIDETIKLIKIHSQLFVDDFEKVIKTRYNISSLDFSNLNENHKQIIGDYITKKMKLKANREPLKLHYLGCELEGELLYVYVEAKYKESIKRLDVENALLQEVFSEQQNKVDISYKNKIKSLHLHAEIPGGAVFF